MPRKFAPPKMTASGARKISLFIPAEEFAILERIGKRLSPDIEPNWSEVVRFAIRETGKQKKFR